MAEAEDIAASLRSISRSLEILAARAPAQPGQQPLLRPTDPKWIRVTSEESLPKTPGVRILGENRHDGTLYFFELLKHENALIWRPYPNAYTLLLPEDMADEIINYTYGIPLEGPPAKARPRRRGI